MAKYYGAPPSAYYSPAQFLGPDPSREIAPAIRNLGKDLKEQSKYEDKKAMTETQMGRTWENMVKTRQEAIRKNKAKEKQDADQLAFDEEKAAEQKRIQDRLEKKEDDAWDFIRKLDPELGYRDRVAAVGQAGFMNIPSVKAQMEREEKIWLAKQKNWRTGQVVKGRAGKGKSKIESEEEYLAWLTEYSKAAKLGGDIIEDFQENVPVAKPFGKPGAVGSKDLSETARMRERGIDFAIKNPHLFEPGGRFYGQSPADIKRGAVLNGQNLLAPPQAAPSVNTRPGPPEAAVSILQDTLGDNKKTNAEKAQVVQFFENKYGKGSAAPYLK